MNIAEKAKWFASLSTKEQSDYLEKEYKKLESESPIEVLRDKLEDLLFDIEVEEDTCNIPSLSKKENNGRCN